MSCVTTAAESLIDKFDGRGLREHPEVDSGPKPIRAVVTDAAGQMDEASVDFYVILYFAAGCHIMRRGESDRAMAF